MMSEEEHEAREGSGCSGCEFCWAIFGVGYNSTLCPECFGIGCTTHGSLIEAAGWQRKSAEEVESWAFSIIFTAQERPRLRLPLQGYPRPTWEIRRLDGSMRPEVVGAFELLQALRVFHARHGLPRSAASLLDELEAHRAHAKLLEQVIRDASAERGGAA